MQILDMLINRFNRAIKIMNNNINVIKCDMIGSKQCRFLPK